MSLSLSLSLSFRHTHSLSPPWFPLYFALHQGFLFLLIFFHFGSRTHQRNLSNFLHLFVALCEEKGAIFLAWIFLSFQKKINSCCWSLLFENDEKFWSSNRNGTNCWQKSTLCGVRCFSPSWRKFPPSRGSKMQKKQFPPKVSLSSCHPGLSRGLVSLPSNYPNWF